MSKRTLDAFFKPTTQPSIAKKLKSSSDPPSPPSDAKEDATETIKETTEKEVLTPEANPSYPYPIAKLPSHISVGLSFATPAQEPRAINDQPNLNLLYYEPYIPQPTAKEYFHFLRCELPFYRVRYTVKRGPTETVINTPRYTTVFGVDTTSYFSKTGEDLESKTVLLDSKTNQPVKPGKYKCTPRPIPSCLDLFRRQVEEALADGTTYNFVLVNYYASGDDSISYHSDDERFLGANPNIASMTLGAKRDFLMKHKPPPSAAKDSLSSSDKPLKIPLATGDMIIMRGETQANWLHSIPKRKGGDAGQGRINITLRKAIVPGGTENYYRYNVSDGGLYRWDDKGKEMVCQNI
ncbi:hypothetical protein PISL3812_01192 [Talaromyces islandicus]|uniref:Fe2OG dioxygenase domain-containing protein n=1 Tax=Talaromyces islandicus TaxID=28573 RepID=A0A0U1LN50_TALIS|nr:hypothetical protein PISL3812_01192 [Talaromyces islandicus]